MINTSDYYTIINQLSPLHIDKTTHLDTKKEQNETISFAKEMASAFHKNQNEIAQSEQPKSSYFQNYLEETTKNQIPSEKYQNEKALILLDAKSVYAQNVKLQGQKAYESSSAQYIAAPLDFKVNYRPKTTHENPIYYNFLGQSENNPYNRAIKMMQAQKAYNT